MMRGTPSTTRYRIVCADRREPVAVDLPAVAPRGRSTPATVELAEEITLRKSQGGDLLLYRRGEPRGKTVEEALEAGWAWLVEPVRERAHGSAKALTVKQVQALDRLFSRYVRDGAGER